MATFRSTAAALAALLALAAAATAQDDALDRLLREIEEPPAPAPSGDAADAEDDDEKPAGTMEEEDEALDRLLEGFLDEPDRPEASGSAPPDADSMRPERPDQLDAAKRDLDADDQSFDEHLRRLLGRIDPSKDRQQRRSGGGGGPLGETMKKMREVEQRLAKLDTGAKTREQQEQIVRDFEQLLKQLRQQQQQQQNQPKQQQTEMAGRQNQSKQQQNDSPDSTNEQGGAPPRAPEQNPTIAGAKDSWGHLQGALREAMGNISRMQPLDEKRDLIERYFTSVAKESVDR